MSEPAHPARNLTQQRERTVALLCDHFALDHLELPDFEARLDAAHRATTPAALDSLLTDLPAADRPVPARPAQRTPGTRGTRVLLALLGGVDRRGHWTPARKTFVVAVMGGAELDFRDVDLPPGVTEVSIICCMGGAEVIVPPGMAVDSNGIAIMGGFEHASAPGRADADRPTLRISGLCLMGGVEISVRHPGESAKDARIRRREERRTVRTRSRLPPRGEE